MNDEASTGRWLTGLRSAALFALVIGAIGSIALWVHAAEHPPLLIIILFVIWVLSPFVVLGIAHFKAKRWAPGTQTALYSVTLFVALASIVVYGDDALGHRTAHPAFIYVAVPPVAWVLTVVGVAIGAWRARGKKSEIRSPKGKRAIMSSTTLKRPSAWLPVAMSVIALAIIVIHIARFGTGREADEGTSAHLWQILMAGQLPIIAFFAIRWLPTNPKSALVTLALQAVAGLAAVAPVFYFRL